MARRTVASKRAQKTVQRRQRKRELRQAVQTSDSNQSKPQRSHRLKRTKKVKAKKRDKYAAGGKFSNVRQRGYQNVPSGALVAATLGVAPTPQSVATAAALSQSLGLDTPSTTTWLPKPRKPKKAPRPGSAGNKKPPPPSECPVARAILNATAEGATPAAAAPTSLYADVLGCPTPREKKELLLARTLLQQFCQQSGVAFTAQANVTEERNKVNLPIFLAHAKVTVDGHEYVHSAPSTSPNVATQLAQRGLLFQLFPGCQSLAEVQQQLKANQKRSKKERQTNSKQKREQFIMQLFPGCASAADDRAQMRAAWPTRKERRKRPHEESEGAAGRGPPRPAADAEDAAPP
eukprot:EG_transcript_18365